jgi:hypothetical protein
MSARAAGTAMLKREVESTLRMFMRKARLFIRSDAEMAQLLFTRQPEQGIYLA